MYYMNYESNYSMRKTIEIIDSFSGRRSEEDEEERKNVWKHVDWKQMTFKIMVQKHDKMV